MVSVVVMGLRRVSRVVVPGLFAQRCAEHLAGGVGGQLLEELEVARDLVAGQPLVEVGAQRELVEVGAGPEHDVRAADLAPLRVRHGDDGGGATSASSAIAASTSAG